MKCAVWFEFCCSTGSTMACLHLPPSAPIVTLRASSSGAISPRSWVRLCLPGNLLSAGTPLGCVEFVFFVLVSSLSIRYLRRGLSCCLILSFSNYAAFSSSYRLIPHWSVAILFTIAFFTMLFVLRPCMIIPALGNSL